MIDLPTFYSKTFENGINESLFFRNFVLDSSLMKQYIDDIINIPITNYLDFIIDKDLVRYLNATAIVQFSSINDATSNLCFLLEQHGDEGFSFTQIGELLLNDGIKRKDGAYKKYGENHTKAALELGLIQVCYDHYYLSCLGKIFPSLNEETKMELLRRTVLRNAFIQRLVKLAASNVCSIKEQLSFLSKSTITRRLPNIKTFLQLIRGNDKKADVYLKNIVELQNSLF